MSSKNFDVFFSSLRCHSFLTNAFPRIAYVNRSHRRARHYLSIAAARHILAFFAYSVPGTSGY
jgi:hypothetical protein